jgi:hypothetical protein
MLTKCPLAYYLCNQFVLIATCLACSALFLPLLKKNDRLISAVSALVYRGSDYEHRCIIKN